MIQHKQTNKKRYAPLLAAGLLVLAGIMAASPTLGNQLDPAPATDPDTGAFTLPVEEFARAGSTGNWVTDATEQTARQTQGGNFPSFFIHPDDIRDVEFRVTLNTPSSANGLVGFALHHKAPVPGAGGTFYDTVIVDWSNQSQEISGRTSSEGLTLYGLKGFVPDTTAARLDCFFEKNDTSCPADIDVLDTYYGFERGWVPGEEYEFRIRWVGHNFPGQAGFKVDVRGGPEDRPYHTAFADAFVDTVEVGWYQTDPAGFGFYTYRQGGAEWSALSYTDGVRPELEAEMECLDPAPGGWCHGPAEFLVTKALDHGTGLKEVNCTVNGDPIAACAADPFAPFQVMAHDGRVRIEAVDHAGNFRAANFNTKIDIEPPEVEASAECLGDVVNGWCNADVAVDLQASALSGIASKSCTLNGLPFGCSATVIDDGHHVFAGIATSTVGLSAGDSTAFSRDATNPLGDIVEPTPGCIYQDDEQGLCAGVTIVSGFVNISVLADDDFSAGVASGYNRTEFVEDGNVLASIDAPGDNGYYNFTWAPSNGDRTLEVRLIDDAGNVATRTFDATVLPLPPLP